ncbi:Protein kinase involved in bud growth and assembly of the septin ring [Pseudohyphozyma bogoriensis]|nr:Protein kinase involved in bud growth and assembly of the septin ring [Pseudohyphozyma bogoriensis]
MVPTLDDVQSAFALVDTHIAALASSCSQLPRTPDTPLALALRRFLYLDAVDQTSTKMEFMLMLLYGRPEDINEESEGLRLIGRCWQVLDDQARKNWCRDEQNNWLGPAVVLEWLKAFQRSVDGLLRQEKRQEDELKKKQKEVKATNGTSMRITLSPAGTKASTSTTPRTTSSTANVLPIATSALTSTTTSVSKPKAKAETSGGHKREYEQWLNMGKFESGSESEKDGAAEEEEEIDELEDDDEPMPALPPETAAAVRRHTSSLVIRLPSSSTPQPPPSTLAPSSLSVSLSSISAPTTTFSPLATALNSNPLTRSLPPSTTAAAPRPAKKPRLSAPPEPNAHPAPKPPKSKAKAKAKVGKPPPPPKVTRTGRVSMPSARLDSAEGVYPGGDYKVGDAVMAVLPGWSWWPSVVCSEEDVPDWAKIRGVKGAKGAFVVKTIAGGGDWTYVAPKNLRKFTPTELSDTRAKLSAPPSRNLESLPNAWKKWPEALIEGVEIGSDAEKLKAWREAGETSVEEEGREKWEKEKRRKGEREREDREWRVGLMGLPREKKEEERQQNHHRQEWSADEVLKAPPFRDPSSGPEGGPPDAEDPQMVAHREAAMQVTVPAFDWATMQENDTTERHLSVKEAHKREIVKQQGREVARPPPHRFQPIDEGWRLGNYLGGGSFGRVFEISDPHGKVWAIKFFRYEPQLGSSGKRSEWDCARQECLILQHITAHHRTNHLQTVFKTSLPSFNITQRMEYTLKELMRAFIDPPKPQHPKPLPPSMVRNFCRQIMLGLVDLYELGIAHLDLKPSNILITGDYGSGWLLQISDFGGSYLKTEREKMEIHILTPAYASPEAIMYHYLDRTEGHGPLTSDGMIGGLKYMFPHAADSDFQAVVRRAPLPLTADFQQRIFGPFRRELRLLSYSWRARGSPQEVLEMPYLKSLEHKEVRYHSVNKYRARARGGSEGNAWN